MLLFILPTIKNPPKNISIFKSFYVYHVIYYKGGILPPPGAQSQDFSKSAQIDPFLDVENQFLNVRSKIFVANSCFFTHLLQIFFVDLFCSSGSFLPFFLLTFLILALQKFSTSPYYTCKNIISY